MKRLFILILLLLFAMVSLAQRGMGHFDEEIKVGTKASASTPAAGMIQHTGGDFQGYTGSAWRSFFELGVNYANVITVAKSGGDASSIQTGINMCGATSPSNTCLVRVMPGTYAEAVITTVPFMHLQGAGKYNTTIQGMINTTDSCVIDGFTITLGVQCIGTSPKITNNIITNLFGPGILVDGRDSTASPWIKQNEIRRCESYGIECLGPQNFATQANPWIILNKIDSNYIGGIFCLENAWPTISNNQILHNRMVGIEMNGPVFPTEPTITDNVIGGSRGIEGMAGAGILHMGHAEPRIIGNDIYTNTIGIVVLDIAQPSILSNEINYNDSIGIHVATLGNSKRVTIQGNHIHSNGWMGIEVINSPPGGLSNPIISQNVITYHSDGILTRGASPGIYQNTIIQNGADINYNPPGGGPPYPVVNMNVLDVITGGPGAAGAGNLDQTGAVVTP